MEVALVFFADEYFGKWFVIVLDVLRFFSSAILLIRRRESLQRRKELVPPIMDRVIG